MITFVRTEAPLKDVHIATETAQRCWGNQGEKKHSFYSLFFLYLSLFVVHSLSM